MAQMSNAMRNILNAGTRGDTADANVRRTARGYAAEAQQRRNAQAYRAANVGADEQLVRNKTTGRYTKIAATTNVPRGYEAIRKSGRTTQIRGRLDRTTGIYRSSKKK